MIPTSAAKATDGAPEAQLFSRSPEQMKTMIEQLSKERFPIERLGSLANAADARKDLVDDFKRITGTNGDANKVMQELALYSRESHRGEKFLEQANTPEKKNLFRRGWEGIKNFAKKHPYVTAALVAAMVAGGVAAGFYFAGEWELLMSTLGVNKVKDILSAVRKLAPVTPNTPLIPGGGMYDIPPPLPGPGEFPHVPI